MADTLQMRTDIEFTRARMTPTVPTNTIAGVRREATQLAKQWKMDLVVDTWRENILFWGAGSGWCEAGGEGVNASVHAIPLYRSHHRSLHPTLLHATCPPITLERG